MQPAQWARPGPVLAMRPLVSYRQKNSSQSGMSSGTIISSSRPANPSSVTSSGAVASSPGIRRHGGGEVGHRRSDRWSEQPVWSARVDEHVGDRSDMELRPASHKREREAGAAPGQDIGPPSRHDGGHLARPSSRESPAGWSPQPLPLGPARRGCERRRTGAPARSSRWRRTCTSDRHRPGQDVQPDRGRDHDSSGADRDADRAGALSSSPGGAQDPLARFVGARSDRVVGSIR